MAAFAQALLDGLATGSLYAMIALGYTLVYGIIRLINFAHGEFFMIGAYVGLFVLASPLGAPSSPLLFALVLALALAAAAGSAALLAVLTERVAYRPIRRYDRIAALLTAIGISFLLQNLARLFFLPNPRSYTPADYSSAYARFLDWYRAYGNLFGLEIQHAKMLTLAVAGLSMGSLYGVVMKTRMGTAMRATAQDNEAAQLMGINTNAVIAQAFALGGLFAGVAGMLTGMLYNVTPLMGFMPGLKAFIAAVVGGIGSIPGAAVGGLAIGLAETLAIHANIDPAYRDAVAFALLVVILLFRSGGILGIRQREKV